MAFIRHFQQAELQRYKLHDDVEANYYLCERDGRRLLQINTYGRDERENPGKQSQSIQLDENSAAQLFSILRDHFGFR